MSLMKTPLMSDGPMTPPPTPAADANAIDSGKAITKFPYPIPSYNNSPVLDDAPPTPASKPNGDGPVTAEDHRVNTEFKKAERHAIAPNVPHLVILSPPNPGLSGEGGGTVMMNDGNFQPPLEWMTSFPVASYTTLDQDQKMSAISSSPALLLTSAPFLNGEANGSSSNAPVAAVASTQQSQQQSQQQGRHQGSGNNLNKIVSRYAEMSHAWMEQQRREQQQRQHFYLQQQQMGKRIYSPQPLHRGGLKGAAAPKYLVAHLQNMTLNTSDSLSMAGFGRLPVRSDEEAFAPFQFLAVLGKGNFGKVILCRDQRQPDRRLCAIKVLKKKEIVKKREVVHTMTEVSVLKSFKHPFLVECYAAFQTATRLCLVLEYVVGGELYFQLFKKRRFSEEQTRFYVSEIVLAVGFLHANDFIYRDLKLENLLLDATGHIKITDFGLCKDLRAWKNEQMIVSTNDAGGAANSSTSSSAAGRRRSSSRKDMTFCGTPEYLAPEMLQVPGAFNGVSRGNGGGACGLIYGKGVDWWALGIIVFEMLLGKLPFRTKTGDYDQLFHSICHRDISLPDSLVGGVRELLDGLLRKNPLQRLGHSNGNGRDYLDICESRWFVDVDWDAVYEKRLPPPFVPRVDNEEDTQHFAREFLDLPTALTPTTSFGGGGGGARAGRGGIVEDNFAAPFIDDLFRGFSFTRN